MKGRLILLIAVLMFVSGLGGLAMRLSAGEGDGAARYARSCAGCHGAQRQGGYGPALTDLGSRTDADLFEIIAQGVGGMPGLAGQLSDEEMQALVQFIKGSVTDQLQGSEEEPVAPTPSASRSDTDPSIIFAERCAGCHGDKGQGGYGPLLTGLQDRSDAELSETITQGSGGMPGFEERLSEAEMEALLLFIKDGLSTGSSEEGQTEDTAQTVTTVVLTTTLNLALTSEANGVITAKVDLQSGDGNPIPNASVTLYRQTIMGGNLPVAEVTTNAEGKAVVQVAPVKTQTLALEATFAGTDRWGAAKAQGGITLSGAAALPPVISSWTSASPPPLFAAIFVVVIGGVWVTYGYVVYQLLQIATQRKKR